MSRPSLSISLAGLLRNAAGAVCGCGARVWSMAVERNLVGMTVRAEVRSR